MIDLARLAEELEDPASDGAAAMRRLVRRLDQELVRIGQEAEIFSLWESENAYLYGLGAARSGNETLRSAALQAQFGAGVEPERLLKAIQTAYSVLIRLLAWDRIGSGTAELEEILTGRAFRAAGIRHFCGMDWFCWVLEDAAAMAECRELRRMLAEMQQERETEVRPGQLKRIYEAVMPPEFRHASGEYYTPDWLAEWGVEAACRSAGKAATALRFCDPACGAGTFLYAAQRRGAAVWGIDLNPLAVLTARMLLLAMGAKGPVWHCDCLLLPEAEDGALRLWLGGREVLLPEALCRKALAEGAEALTGIGALEGWDGWSRQAAAELLYEQIGAFFTPRADVLAGNPPWVNWEYLPEHYRARTAPLWQKYGLIAAKGRELSFLKEDLSVLLLYAGMDRLLHSGGTACVVLRQSLLQSERSGAGFRRFVIAPSGEDICVMRAEDLSRVKVFGAVNGRAALVTLKKGTQQVWPVPYGVWTQQRGFRRAEREGRARERLQVREEEAWPSRAGDPGSVWVHAPRGLRKAVEKVLGKNPYRARTGVFTGGANAVYWLEMLGRTDGGLVRVRNITQRARRPAEEVTAELEPELLWPLVRGNDLTFWRAESHMALLCPHTEDSGIYPLEEEVLRRQAPEVWRYLQHFRPELEARRGFAGWERAIQARYFYALLRIGAYTFAPYKVAWRYVAKEFVPAVLSETEDPVLGSRMLMPSEKVMFVGLRDRDEAFYLCGLLSSAAVRCCVQCYMNPTSISAHVLSKLYLPAFEREDARCREIAALCERGHAAQAGAERREIRRELDAVCAALYGSDAAEQREIQEFLGE